MTKFEISNFKINEIRWRKGRFWPNPWRILL